MKDELKELVVRVQQCKALSPALKREVIAVLLRSEPSTLRTLEGSLKVAMHAVRSANNHLK